MRRKNDADVDVRDFISGRKREKGWRRSPASDCPECNGGELAVDHFAIREGEGRKEIADEDEETRWE